MDDGVAADHHEPNLMGEAQAQEISEVGGKFDPGHKKVFEGLPTR
jgi:hypothetical protein